MVQHINIVKYREIPNKFCLTSRFIFKVMVIIKLLILTINCFGITIYVFDIPQYLLSFALDIILILLSICCFSLVKKSKYILLSILAILLITAYGSNILFYNENTTYTEYISPIDNTIIVVKSSGYLFSGTTNYYIKQNILLKNTKITVELDEGYQQVRNADTQIDWTEDSATFNYYNKDTNEYILSKVIPL